MNRYRWLQVDWPFSMRVLAKRLKAMPFSEGSPHGFVIDRVRDDYVEARYIERLEFTEKVVDPFGQELSFARLEFRQSAFRAASASPGLELIDAPRSIQNLLMRLSELSDFSVAIGPFTVDVLAWAQSLQQASNLDNLVDSLQIGSLELDDGVVAKAVIKGSRDVRSAASALAGKKKFVLEKLQLKFCQPGSGAIVLTNDGSAKVQMEMPHDAMLEALRQSLTACCS